MIFGPPDDNAKRLALSSAPLLLKDRMLWTHSKSFVPTLVKAGSLLLTCDG